MTTTWKTRAQLGLAPPIMSHLSPRHDRVLGVTVHWTATTNLAPDAVWKTIQRNEQAAGYGDIAYNAGFTDAGEILAGRDNGWVGAHATSEANVANRTTYGIAYVGNGRPTVQAVQALRAYLYVVILTLKLPHPIQLLGHQEWEPFGGIATACPGSIEPIVRAIRNELHAQIP